MSRSPGSIASSVPTEARGQLRMHLEVVYENGVRKSIGSLGFPILSPAALGSRLLDVTNWIHNLSEGVVESESFSTHPANWGPSVIRRGELTLAFLKMAKLEDGIDLHPQKLRSSMGNQIKKLNDLFPGLNMTDEEGRDLVVQLIEFLTKELLKPNREERRQGIDRHDVGG